ncbi:porin family protein [Devosia sp. ZB163]|uniref:outer membrane protein n=1 Tax=Devosia sp. ZB163 TaxID=3025938 RepID=UPI002362D6F6|nr:outer membrane protein [Devosia sp. ZB163]MDC9824990.1 porin family protein [Devosia sp. ZB163]
MKRITTLLLATVAGAGLMSTAYAADLIIEEPGIVEPVVVGGNWDGAFIGGFIGGGWGEADHEYSGLGDGNDIDLSGWFVGVDAGFNFTVGSGLVLGVVGDIAWTDIGGSIVDPPVGAYDEITHDINWQGSLRGRVGFDGGAFLPYLTGGLAFANATRETFNFDDGPFDNTHVGWTVGAGVEFAVSEELSVDLLYRYSDYGTEIYNDGGQQVPKVSLTTHTVQAGLHWSF